MRISTRWLEKYVSLEGKTPKQLAEAMTTAGIEIEGIEALAKGTNLIIGQVVECKEHPDSDHLQVCQVNIGKETVQIVCGAPNCQEGIKVIVAQVGAELPEITIKKAKVRGVESNGMLCSLLELGVGEKYLKEDQIKGIEILSVDAPIGETEVLAYLGLDDHILDASLTPNRADCLAMWSVAKEVGAILRREVRLPELNLSFEEKETQAVVKTKTENCPHILGKVVRKVVVKESPEWMKKALQAAGIKSINNVVDISNYVMLETGQPLHFYDLSKMKKEELFVESNHEGKFLALDGEEYTLKKEDLVIVSDGEIVGLAGIMGSDGSKIDEATTGILIEAANFNAVSIRNTSKRLTLMTEAASRFAKGLDALAQGKAMNRALDLLCELASADEIENTVSDGEVHYEEVKIQETLSHCNELLGTSYSIEEVVEVLSALDFSPKVEGDTVTCRIPSYRRDIKIAEDLDEEIIRLIGFDGLETTLPKMEMTEGRLSKAQKLRRRSREILTAQGLSEIITYTLVKESYMNKALMAFGNPVQLASPMSENRKFVRNSLMNSMLECLSYNQARKATNVNLFEISNVYQEEKVQERCGIVISEALHQSRFHGQKIDSDFFALKGIILSWLKAWGFSDGQVEFRENEIDKQHFHPYRSAAVYIQGKMIGVFGEVHPQVVKEWDITPCSYGEFILDYLHELEMNPTRFKPLVRYPAVSRDLALVTLEEVSAKQILDVIHQAGHNLVQTIEVFDVYQGEHIEQGYKSIALSIIYQAKDHTLVEDEIQEVHQEILEQLKLKLNATLRT